MTIYARTEYLSIMRTRYREAEKTDRSLLLDEICENCGCSRKHAIRVMNTMASSSKSPKVSAVRGRPQQYHHPEILEFLQRLRTSMNLACSIRLKAAIPDWLPSYETAFHHTLSDESSQRLLSISASTIDRLLAPTRKGGIKLGLATTKPGSVIKKQIPVRINQWDETRPGYLEADTVAHCGTSVEGQFVYTLNTVDIATGWTEQRAAWGKGQTGIFNAIIDIEDTLPFRLRGFDCDNGSEFINWHLYDYLHRNRRNRRVQFTRGREGHPNDNAHVEEKNWTLVRQYLGYERFDNREIVSELNALYRGPWRLFVNGFLPSVKLIEKQRDGARVIKRYDKPQTPLERVLVSPTVPRAEKQVLKATFANLNPFLLQEQIRQTIQDIIERATCGNPECSYHLNKATNRVTRKGKRG